MRTNLVHRRWDISSRNGFSWKAFIKLKKTKLYVNSIFAKKINDVYLVQMKEYEAHDKTNKSTRNSGNLYQGIRQCYVEIPLQIRSKVHRRRLLTRFPTGQALIEISSISQTGKYIWVVFAIRFKWKMILVGLDILSFTETPAYKDVLEKSPAIVQETLYILDIRPFKLFFYFSKNCVRKKVCGFCHNACSETMRINLYKIFVDTFKDIQW